MTDFSVIFDQQYRDLCNPPNRKAAKYKLDHDLFQRGDGFALIWRRLLDLKKDQYNIVETGVLRRPGNWIDGQSTFLFQEFLRLHGGHIQCVDINLENCASARAVLDARIVSVTCSDSLDFLPRVPDITVDLWHLDSWDVKWHNDQRSAQHHLQEFQLIESRLHAGALVMIDDNAHRQGQRVGKGRRVYEYLADKNIFPIYDHYQIIYQF